MSLHWHFPAELLGAVLVYCIGLERKKNFKLRVLLVIGIFLGHVLFGTFLIGQHMQDFFAIGRMDYNMIYVIIANITILLVVSFFMVTPILVLMEISAKEILYCLTCAYLSEHMAYCIRILVNAGYDRLIRGTGYGTNSIAGTGKPLWLLIHVLVYVVSYYVFSSKMIHNQHYSTTALKSVGLMLIAAFLVIGMSIAASIYGFEPIHAIYALCSCIFLLYSQLKQQSQLNLQEELLLQQQMWVKHNAQYEMSKETIDIINTKCHDLKHQVAALRTLQDKDARSQVIDSIEGSVMIYDNIVKTGNDILDTVLTEKGLICQQKQILLSCMVDGKLMNFMDAVDLYTLFGNALDNAMEAVSRLPKEMRSITLHLKETMGMIILQVENPYQGEVKMCDGIPVTSKKEKAYHGFGVKSMMQIVEKYNGFMKIETENQMFVIRITVSKEDIS